jgi:catechol 2,3-dioxygenase-like lactoylglutathione lyase family enzyme
MAYDLHHVHLFASDVDRSIRFYQDIFDAEVLVDSEFAGARNIFLKIGRCRIHLYDQRPKHPGRGSMHHIGIRTDDLDGALKQMKKRGVVLNKGIRDHGIWRYVMVPAPDDILVELFEVDEEKLPSGASDLF